MEFEINLFGIQFDQALLKRGDLGKSFCRVGALGVSPGDLVQFCDGIAFDLDLGDLSSFSSEFILLSLAEGGLFRHIPGYSNLLLHSFEDVGLWLFKIRDIYERGSCTWFSIEFVACASCEIFTSTGIEDIEVGDEISKLCGSRNAGSLVVIRIVVEASKRAPSWPGRLAICAGRVVLVLFVDIDLSLVFSCNTTVFSSDRVEIVEILLNSRHSKSQSFGLSCAFISFELKQSPFILSEDGVIALITAVARVNGLVDVVILLGFS